MPGIWELIIILVIVLLVFGGKRLKNIGGDLGSAIKGFKKSMGDNDSVKTTADATIHTKDSSSDDVIEAQVVHNEADKPKEESDVKTNSKS